MVRSLWIAVVATFVLGCPFFAVAEVVQFTNKELAAVFTLMRPELNSIELHGRKAIIDPAPSIRFLGVEHTEADLDLSMIGNIADIEFNHIKAKTPQLKFAEGSFQLVVAVEDQARAVQSRLGSISFKNVVLTAQLGWQTRPNGMQELVLQKTIFSGALSGSGVLRSGFILGKTRDLCLALMTKSLRKFLAGEKIQSSIQQGLVMWSQFYLGVESKEVSATQIEFYNDGLRYHVN